MKDTQIDDKRRYEFLKEKVTNQDVLDFGCGIGGFLDYTKQIAKSVVGIELEEALQASFKSRELTVFRNINYAKESGNKWDLITAFHVIEHLKDPVEMIKELSTLLNEEGEMIIEVPSSEDALLSLYNSSQFQNFTYWSQHLFLFNQRTIHLLVEKTGLKLNWIKHIQRYPLSNHLYWLSKGKPGGHKKLAFMYDNSLNEKYEQQLASLGLTDTIILGVSL